MNSLPQRKSPRLQGYDYSQSGAYFVTICTVQRIECFGAIAEGNMTRSPLGEIAHHELARLPERWPNVDLDLFVVMPNHVHAIFVIDSVAMPDAKNGVPTRGVDVGTAFLPSERFASSKPTLGNVVGAYKSGVTRIAREEGLLDDGTRLWQARYHDHIIRSEPDLNRIREYVITNSARWHEDTFYSG